MVMTLISNTHNHGISPVVMRVKILLLIRYSIVYLLRQISFMTTSVFILCLMGRGVRLTQILYIHSRLKWAKKSKTGGDETRQLKG